LLDRVLIAFLLSIPWWSFWALISVTARSGTPIVLFGGLPWLLLLLDTLTDHFHTKGDVEKLVSQDDVALATRAEYLGGHPQLPHGRFAYLTLRGSREDPTLTLVFPSQRPEGVRAGLAAAPVNGNVGLGDDDRFDIPLLDIATLDARAEQEGSLTQALVEPMLAQLKYRGGSLFRGERVTMSVAYQGPGGRRHSVELTSFLRGNDEIHNWRNYLICAQAEADTGTVPYGPWKSLRAGPEEVASDDLAGNGSKLQPARRAFERR
jgi:hypothetical protein